MLLVDAIMVLMQVGREGDWTDRGLPEVVTGYGHATSAVAAASEWMFTTNPGIHGDDWRLLVWTGIRGGSWSRDRPDVVVSPGMYRAAVTELGLGRARSRLRRRKLGVGAVIAKVYADQLEIGDRVLVTPDRHKSNVPGSSGPWFVADYVAADCIAVRITGWAELTRGDQRLITYRTAIGEIDNLPPDATVIPVDEQD